VVAVELAGTAVSGKESAQLRSRADLWSSHAKRDREDAGGAAGVEARAWIVKGSVETTLSMARFLSGKKIRAAPAR
jgi:hypothetical protein